MATDNDKLGRLLSFVLLKVYLGVTGSGFFLLWGGHLRSFGVL